MQDVQGTVLVAIASGQVIIANNRQAELALGPVSEYLRIPKGYVALTIPTSEQQGVADYIQPGDYISVIATVSSAGRVAEDTSPSCTCSRSAHSPQIRARPLRA